MRCRVDIAAGAQEFENGGDDVLPVGAERHRVLDQRRALSRSVKTNEVVAALAGCGAAVEIGLFGRAVVAARDDQGRARRGTGAGEDIAGQGFAFVGNVDGLAPTGARRQCQPEGLAMAPVGLDEPRIGIRSDQEHIGAAVVIRGAQERAICAGPMSRREAGASGVGETVRHREPGTAPDFGVEIANRAGCRETFAQIRAAGMGVSGRAKPLRVEEFVLERVGHGVGVVARALKCMMMHTSRNV